MKKKSMMIAALALASLARAAITIDYIAAGDPAGMAARAVIHDVGADTVAIAGITAPGASGTFGGTSTGTFDILLTAIGEETGVSVVDPANWSFTAGAGTALAKDTTGWGITSTQESAVTFNNPEALILDFNLSNLNLVAGEVLRLVSITVRDTNGKLQCWEQTGPSSGSMLVGTITSGEDVVWTLNREISDQDSFVIRDVGSGQKRLKSMVFEIVGASIQPPAGLGSLAWDSEVVLDWDDDATGQLDYYTVYRSISSGVTTDDTLTNMTSSSYTDSAVTNGITYFYAVTATDTNGTVSGLSDEVSATPETVPTNAIPFQHLDATIASSVTANGSGEVSVWADQSGNGRDAVDGLGDPVLYPSASLSATGLPGMDVRTTRATIDLMNAAESDRLLDFTGSASGKSGFAVLVAFKADSVFDDNTRNQLIGNNASVDVGFLLRYDRGVMGAFLGGTALEKSTSEKVEARDTIVYAFNYTVSSGEILFWDSKNDQTMMKTVAAADFSTTSSMRIAGSGNAGQYMDGMVGEVKIFDQALDAADFAVEREAMTAKWVTVTEIQPPDNLTATVDDEWVELDWQDDISGGLFASYSVYRSTEGGTNYVEIASGLTASEYLDTGMPGGIAYYYVVTAVDTNGMESAFSAEVAAIPNEVVRLQHLDATVPGSVLTDGGAVTQWIDQTTNGNDAVPMVGNVFYPSTSLSESGLAGVDVQSGRNSLELFSAAGSDVWLDQSADTGGFSVMVALKCDAVVTGNNNDVIGNSADGFSGIGMRYTGAGEIEAWLGGQLIASAGPNVVNDGDTLIFALNYDAVAGSYDFWDSKNYTSSTGALAKADFSSADPVTVGSAASASRWLDGMVGEVKVFGSRLSPAHFERERLALLNKWTERPNIVLIFVDDWAWNGSPVRMDDRMPNSMMEEVEMPNFETVAEQGMRFRNAYCSAMCVPSRACVQTGMSSARHQLTVELSVTDYYDTRSIYDGFPVIGNGIRKPLPDSITTIPEALRPLGYKCAHYGKWHLDSDPAVEGYEESDGNTDNKLGGTLEDVTVIPPDFTNPKRMDEITDRAIAFMQKKVAEDSPFYVQLSHYAQHEPRECRPASRARYQNLPRVVELNGGKTDPNLISARSDPAVWLGMAYDLDGTIGRVLDELDALGIADNTYVIIMSDNGYRHNIVEEQPLHAQKWWVWQGGIRVPMIARGPGIPANSLCTANVVNYDLLPTYVDWAGGDPTRLQGLDGISLERLMEGKPPTEDFLNRSLYFHYPHYRTTMPHSSIVKGNYKAIYFYETPVRFPAWDPIMLFDLASDPGEYHNIQPEKPAVAQALYSDLTNHLAVAGGRVPANNAANYNSAVYEAATEFDARVAAGPFIGTRTLWSDEAAQIQTFTDYWMGSWGVNLGSMTNDFDGDGIVNWAEYATGGNPTNALDIGAVPMLEQEAGAMNYIYARRNDDSDLVYTVETSTNLVSGVWTPAGGSPEINKTAGVFDDVVHGIPADDPQAFFRLKIEQN